MKKSTLFFLFLTLGLFQLTAQIEIPVTWKYEVKEIGNSEAELILKATIEDKWHMYSQHTPEGGPLSLFFEWEASDKYELIGVVEEPKHYVEYDETFKIDTYYFKKEATFTQKIKILSSEPFNIKGVSDYQACIDGKCVPGGDDMLFPINGGVQETDASEEKAIQPVAFGTFGGDEEEHETVSTIEAQEEDEASSRSIWGIIIEAILWGLAAILTPCVFPMVPMTVSFFMKGGENKAKGKAMASVYGISIIGLYTLPIAILILVSVFVGGEAITADIFNWISTHWLPNILFFLIFMIFAASFLGAFEIVIPSRFVNKADAKADKGGFVGAFFMALTLVIVSFSCTGPIVGTVIVKSTQGGEIWEPIITMFAFSAAFALPFTLFAFFPSWLRNLPKSGGWLNSVKVVLGFVEIALGLKFLSVADQTYHWGILDREIYIAFWIVTFALLGFYLLGKLKFSHDSPLTHISVPRTFLAIATFAFVMYLIPGMFGAPLKALSGYLPPQATHDFDINAKIRDNSFMIQDAIDDKIGDGVVSSSNKKSSELCEKPKYSDHLHLPHGLEGYYDYQQALACAKKQNKPVFIDFTGHGCVNCREMEANVWSHPKVLKKLRNEFVVVALYVDDKVIKLNEDEWYKSSVDGKTKKTLGKMNADLQIARYGTNAQPYYVLMGLQEETLVKPIGYDLNVDNFLKFLDKGIEEFNKKYSN